MEAPDVPLLADVIGETVVVVGRVFGETVGGVLPVDPVAGGVEMIVGGVPPETTEVETGVAVRVEPPIERNVRIFNIIFRSTENTKLQLYPIIDAATTRNIITV